MIHHPALPAILGFVALVMIAVPSWVLLDNRRARERGVAGVGMIVEKEERSYQGAFHCWVEFAGRRCRVALKKSTWRKLRAGEALDIRYDPLTPGKIIHGRFTPPRSPLLYGALLLGGIAIAVTAGVLSSR